MSEPGLNRVAAQDAVFHVHQVSKVYAMGDVEVHALRSVTLDLYEGEFVVLLGLRKRKIHAPQYPGRS
jgi:putative ABC transport system ATP-binding protein